MPPLIKTIVQGRYIWIIRKEKIRFRKILIEKEREIKTEIHVDGNQIELNFNINEKATPQYFQIPEKKEIEQIETQTFFEIHNLMQGYKWISKITERMKDRDKIIALNNIRSDIIKIIKGLEIEEHIINNFIINYRLLKKDHPEAIHLITIGYKNLIIEKRQKKDFDGVTISEMKTKIKKISFFFLTLLEHVEEDLKIVESKRIVTKENEQSVNNGKRVIWIGNKEQLLELFFQLNDNGFIPTYDEYIILGHFRIINTDDKEIREKEIYPNSQFLWLGSDKDFVQLINGLVEAGYSPKGSKYKNFSEQFFK